MDSTNKDRSSRREFLQHAAAAAAGSAAAGALAGCGGGDRAQTLRGEGENKPVALLFVYDPADPVASAGPVQRALAQLRACLSTRGIATAVGQRLEQAPAGASRILVAGLAAPAAQEMLAGAGVTLPAVPEALGLVPLRGTKKKAASARRDLLVCGSDVRGLVYALLELADRVQYAAEPLAGLEVPQALVEQPANKIRSIMRVFASDVEDKSWYYDRTFWPAYLSMLAAQRFNRFALALGLGYDFTSQLRDTYFHFAYPFLVSVPGYEVRVAGLSEEERQRNLAMLQFISDETARQGLHFQLGLWTHAYRWTNSPNVNYTIEGLTPQTHAAYCRDALEILLRACPAIGGVTFRVHGESGVAEGSYAFWKTVFEGVAHCGRRVEIDMHAKGMDQAMIDLAVATGLPVNISPKYWAEHMGLPYHQAAIRALELPRSDRKDGGFFSRSSGSRSFLRYGYGDLLAENRPYGVLHRMWPGTQRLLLWGDPALAAAYGQASSFCGSDGVELFEPLSFKGRKGSGLPGGRAGYADAALRPARDYEKYLYGYRLWGRLLYHPQTQPETWRRFLHKEYGPAAQACEEALAHASRILPLFTTAHTPSAANNNYWPEMYTNMAIVDASRPHPYGDTPSPKRFGRVSPLDPQMFAGVDEYAETLIRGPASAKYSPVEVAQWLDGLAQAATDRLRDAEAKCADRNVPAFRRLAVDVAIQAGLGRFFAAKLRAAVFYAIYDRTGASQALEEALKAYRVARNAWADMAAQARETYVRDITFGLEKQLRGHWLDRLEAIDADIADMEKKAQNHPAQDQTSAATPAVVAQAIQTVLGPVERPVVPLVHLLPPQFVAGKPLTIELTLMGQGVLPNAGSRSGKPPAVSVRLCYRQVHQAQSFQVAEMQAQGGHYGATIPGAYTNTPYPLEYYFELHDEAGRAWMYPGFEAIRMNQPYFVVRQG